MGERGRKVLSDLLAGRFSQANTFMPRLLPASLC